MKLYAQAPNRKNGEAWAQVDGEVYKFSGPELSCDVADKAHAEQLQEMGFLTAEDKSTEETLQKQIKALEERKSGKANKSKKSG